MAELKIALHCFVLHLKEVKKTSSDWLHKEEIGWIEDNLRLDEVRDKYKQKMDEIYRMVECEKSEGEVE